MTPVSPAWRIAWMEYQIQLRYWKTYKPAGHLRSGQRIWDEDALLIWNNWASDHRRSLDEVFNGATLNLQRRMFPDA